MPRLVFWAMRGVRRPPLWVLALTVTAVTGIASVGIHGLFGGRDDGKPAHVEVAVRLHTVSSDRLAREGMHLWAPTHGATITAAMAEHLAVRTVPSSLSPTALESVLADVSDPNVPALDGRTLWVVSLTPVPLAAPMAQSAAAPPTTPSFTLAFVDPVIGRLVFSDFG